MTKQETLRFGSIGSKLELFSGSGVKIDEKEKVNEQKFERRFTRC